MKTTSLKMSDREMRYIDELRKHYSESASDGRMPSQSEVIRHCVQLVHYMEIRGDKYTAHRFGY